MIVGARKSFRYIVIEKLSNKLSNYFISSFNCLFIKDIGTYMRDAGSSN